jgi:phage protein D
MVKMLQNRYGSFFKVEYPVISDFDSPVEHISLYQEMGKQDIVEIYYPRLDPQAQSLLRTGVPIKITYGNDKVTEIFFGYVIDLKPTFHASTNRPLVVRCIGASLDLKNGGEKIWINKSAPDVVTEIAKLFKLKPVVTPSPVILESQSMVGQSYWEKCQELARRIGYTCHMFGTELHFHPLDEMINRSMTVIPILSYGGPYIGVFADTLSPTLDSFYPTTSEYSDAGAYGNTEKTIFGFDPVTAKSYSSVNSPNKTGDSLRASNRDALFKEHLPQGITASKTEAAALAKSFAELSRLKTSAKGSGQGDPRIAPYRTVEVEGTSAETDGFWIVRKAVHHIYHTGRYELDFDIVTDGIGRNAVTGSRPTEAGTSPTRNLTTATTERPTRTILTSNVAVVKESDAGFKLTPQRWEGM